MTLRRLGFGTLLALAALLAATGVTWAGGQTFSDVPPAHPFFGQIEAISEAGITNGFNDGTYRPGDNVTRGAMAAFMGRGFGRLDFSADSNVALAASTAGLADVSVGSGASMTAGASGTGTGFVVVQAQLVFETSAEASCPCVVRADVLRVGGDSSPDFEGTINDDPSEGGTSSDTVAVQWVQSLDAGTTATFEVRADVIPTSGDPAFTVSNTLTLHYVPFDEEGNIPPA